MLIITCTFSRHSDDGAGIVFGTLLERLRRQRHITARPPV
jgi:hypothetical protein